MATLRAKWSKLRITEKEGPLLKPGWTIHRPLKLLHTGQQYRSLEHSTNQLSSVFFLAGARLSIWPCIRNVSTCSRPWFHQRPAGGGGGKKRTKPGDEAKKRVGTVGELEIALEFPRIDIKQRENQFTARQFRVKRNLYSASYLGETILWGGNFGV